MYTVYLKKVEESVYILGAGPAGGRKCNSWSGDDSVKIWWTPQVFPNQYAPEPLNTGITVLQCSLQVLVEAIVS